MSCSDLQELFSRLAFTLAIMSLASCQAVLGIDDVSIRPGDGGDLPDSATPDGQDLRVCPAVFTEEYGGHRYFVSSSPLLYDEAMAECFAMGGHLAVVDDAGENDFMAGLLSGYTWIGYDDLIVENSFEWVTGAQPAYSNWNDNEPNNTNGREDCAGMYGADQSAELGRWNDSPCGEQHGYICECDPALEPRSVPGCMTDPAYDQVLEGRRYRWAGVVASWQGAREICWADGAELVVISDANEQTRVAGMVSNTAWLGLWDPGEDAIGPFQWVIGDAMYFNWAIGEPNNAAGQHHGVIDVSNMRWYDRPGNDTYSVMCECDPKSPPTNY
jgi:hypothetical protein